MPVRPGEFGEAGNPSGALAFGSVIEGAIAAGVGKG